MRLNNIELKKCIGSNSRFEIIKHYPNIYYNKESEYLFDGESYYKESGSFIHKSCFKNKEHCYVLTFIENGIPDFIDNRPFELEDFQEMKDYLWLLRKGVSKSFRYKIRKS